MVPTEPVETAEDAKKKPAGDLPLMEAANAPTDAKEDTNVFEKSTDTTEAPIARINVQHIKRQILLIEDNPDMVDQFRRSLQREGFDIFNASIPLEAEAMASGLHPTIIIMDVNFSEGAGWEILERLKRRDDTCDIPVIVVSLSQELERATQLGVSQFIRRPFMPDELVKAVQEAERESRVERILIIDDQPESVRLLQQMLDEQGKFRVFSATNGMEGIAMVARRRPNLIILDLRMPEMDGFQVIRELRNNPETSTIPIVVVTGDTLNEQETALLQNMRVLYKLEMDTERYRQVFEEIETKQNNGRGNS
jgi:CheY-like chemotaxis protein